MVLVLIGLGLVVSGLGLGLGLAFFGLGLGLGLALCGLVNITGYRLRDVWKQMTAVNNITHVLCDRTQNTIKTRERESERESYSP